MQRGTPRQGHGRLPHVRRHRRGHLAGNWLFNRALKVLFGGRFTDVFSGYRVMSRRFVKSFPVRFTGFEIETELVTHTVDIGLPHAEVPTTYRSRDLDSKRKLRTVRDGLRIGVAALLLFKEMRPLRFFTIIAATLTALALGLGAIPVTEFLDTGLVLRLPTALLAASIQIVAFISLTAGIILDSVCHSRRQAKRLVYLSMPPVNARRGSVGVAHGAPNGERSGFPVAYGPVPSTMPRDRLARPGRLTTTNPEVEPPADDGSQ